MSNHEVRFNAIDMLNRLFSQIFMTYARTLYFWLESQEAPRDISLTTGGFPVSKQKLADLFLKECRNTNAKNVHELMVKDKYLVLSTESRYLMSLYAPTVPNMSDVSSCLMGDPL